MNKSVGENVFGSALLPEKTLRLRTKEKRVSSIVSFSLLKTHGTISPVKKTY